MSIAPSAAKFLRALLSLSLEGEPVGRASSNLISQISPSARQSKLISPIRWRIIVFMARVPKSWRAGGITGGPPVSVQRSKTWPSAVWDQLIWMRPPGRDSAPYLAAFVVSSCTVTAIAWAISGLSFQPGLTADIGCGSGREVAWLAGSGYRAIGYDPSERLLAQARERHPGLEFGHAMLPELDGIGDGAFDNVLCETVIMHLSRERVAPSVRGLMRILKSGGVLYLSWRVTEGAARMDASTRHSRARSYWTPLPMLTSYWMKRYQRLVGEKDSSRRGPQVREGLNARTIKQEAFRSSGRGSPVRRSGTTKRVE